MLACHSADAHADAAPTSRQWTFGRYAPYDFAVKRCHARRDAASR